MTTLDELQATAAERWQAWLEQHPDIRPEPHLVDDELGTRLYHSLSSSEHRREPRRR